MAQTPRSVLLDTLTRLPDNPALCIGKTQYTYREFLNPVQALNESLGGVFSRHAAVGVLAEKSLEGYQCIASAFLAGKTYVPLSAHYPLVRNAEIIRQSGIRILLVDRACQQTAEALCTHLDEDITLVVVSADSAGALDYTLIGDSHANTPCATTHSEFANIAYLLFTSGSTGRPKGVPVSDRSVLAYLSQINALMTFRSDDRFSQFFDFTFDLSLHDMLVCWQNGACLCPPDRMAQLMPLQFAAKQNLTVWFSVPSLALTAKDLMRDKFAEFRLDSLRLSLFCGEALPQTLAQEWSVIASNAPVVNLYGPTEATITFTAHTYHPDDADYPVVPIGRPFGVNAVAILDDSGSPCDKGELCLGGDQVFSGYWQADHLTDAAFHDDTTWYRTGDVVSQTDDSTLLYHGRTDRQVQVNGFRVELQEVEHALRELISAGTLAVIAYPCNAIGEPIGLTGFISNELNADEVLELCKQHLPTYMQPKHLLTLNEFPYNASGKLDYKQLARLAVDQID